MKNGSNKKKIITICILAFVCLAAFFPWRIPSLINADKPFVDLAGSVGESIGNATAAYEKSKITPVPTSAPVVTDVPYPVPTDIPEEITEKDEVRLVIGEDYLSGSGETILLEENAIGSIEELKALIKNGVFDGKTVILVDNYAETITYKAVKALLFETRTSYRFDKVTDGQISGNG